MMCLVRWDPLAECWEDGFIFYRVAITTHCDNTGDTLLVYRWVDSLIPDLVDMSFDDRDGKPVDCWGEIFGSIIEVAS